MTISINGTSGIVNDATDLNYTGTLTGGTGVVNLGSGQVYKDASGNVGIGTSSPAYKFDLYNVSGATPGARISGNDQSNVRLRLANVGTGGINWDIVSGLNGVSNSFFSIYDATAGATRLAIDNSGNLMAGTTSLLGASAAGTVHINGGSNNSEEAPLYLRNQFSTAGRYWKVGPTNNGGFIIFNASATGQYMTYGATSWTATSDERLKTNLLPIENAAQKISSLRAVTGRYKTDAEGVSRSFLIAQDVQSVLPEAVDVQDDEKNTLGLRYTEVIPLLVAAIKEQQTLIVSLQDTLTALTARITALEAPIV